MYYGDKQDSLVKLMSGLSYRNWSIYGFKEDKSDSMADYYDPARWDGIAVKNGFILVVENNCGGTIGGDFVTKSYDAKIFKRIKKLQALLDCPNASQGEKTNAQAMIEKFDAKAVTEILVKGDLPPVIYQKNPDGSKWHIERNNEIIAKGTGVYSFSDVNTWKSEQIIFDIRDHNDPQTLSYFRADDWENTLSYRKERRLKDQKRLDKYFKLLDKWESLVVIKLGEGDEEKLVKKIITQKVVHFIAEDSEEPTEYFRVGDKWSRHSGLVKNLIYKLSDDGARVRKLTKKWVKLNDGTNLNAYKPEPNKNTKGTFKMFDEDDIKNGDVVYIKLVEKIETFDKVTYVKSKKSKSLKTTKKVVPQEEVVTPEPSATESKDLLKQERELQHKLYKGELTLTQYKEAFDSFMNHKDAFVAQLEVLQKKDIFALFPSDFMARYKSEKKDFLVEIAYHEFLTQYVYAVSEVFSYQPEGLCMTGDGESIEDAVIRYVKDATQEQFDERIQKREAFRKDLEERKLNIAKAVTEPKILDDFKIFIRVNGSKAMNSEQLDLYDKLVVDEIMAKLQEDKDKKKSIKVEVPEGIGFELIETVHTRDDYPLFVVKVTNRVDKDKFYELRSAAKRLGGWYSKYSKDGAIPGFQFKDEESAEEFMKLETGEEASAASNVEQHETSKSQSRSNKLIQQGKALEEKGEEKLNQPRQANTARRAGMAANAEGDARTMIRVAHTMQNIGKGLEVGEVKYLSGINSKAILEQLESILSYAKYLSARHFSKENGTRVEDERQTPITVDDIRFVEYPYPSFHTSILNEVLNTAKGREKNLLVKYVKSLTDDIIVFNTPNLLETLRGVLRKSEESYQKTTIKDYLIAYDRLQKANIVNISYLRVALKEYINYRGEAKKVNPLVLLERELIGRKIDGYFPTTDVLIDEMIEEADISDGMSFLEPEAGKGSIADKVRDRFSVSIDTIEVNHTLRNILEAKSYNIVSHDMLEYTDSTYDRIIMNPPFEKYQDIDHVQKAFKLLNDGGKLVAIMASSAFHNDHKKAKEFRQWLDECGARFWKNPEGSFLDSDRRTGVNTYMVVIDKETIVVNNPDYSSEQLETFATGSLF